MGAPMKLAKTAQSGAGYGHIRDAIRTLRDYQFESPLRDDAPADRLVPEPIGVCGLITPWNWPMNQIALKVIPALAAGCTCVRVMPRGTSRAARRTSAAQHDSAGPEATRPHWPKL